MKTITLNLIIISLTLCAVNALVCPDTQILDVASQTCLQSKTLCQGSISSDSRSCVTNCSAGEQLYYYTENGNTIFSQCYLCPANNYLQINIDSYAATCVSSCATYEFTDDDFLVCQPCDQLILHISDQLSCDSACPGGTFQQQANEGKNQYYCQSACSASYISNTSNVCISQDSCKGVISSDGIYCTDNCGFHEYKIPVTDTQYKCAFCTKKLIKNTQCVDECPTGYIQLYRDIICIEISSCELFSADNLYCVSQCNYPELGDDNKCINSCLGKSYCEPQCPNSYYKIFSYQGYICLNVCNPSKVLSSDQQYCAESCYKFNEMEPDSNSRICKACQSNEYPILNTKTYTITCTPLTQLTLDNMIQDFKANIGRIDYYNDFRLKQSQLTTIFAQMQSAANKDNSKIMDSINNFLNMVNGLFYSAIQIALSSTLIDNQQLDYRVSIMYPLQRSTYLKDFDISALLSNPYYILSQGKGDYDSNKDYVRSITAFAIKNPFCVTQNCSHSKLFFVNIDTINVQARLLSIAPPALTLTVKFPIDSSISKQVQNLVCISYDSSGTMTGSVANTKLSDDKSSVTCTFQGNSALYLDTTCIYVDKANCPAETDSSNNGGSSSGKKLQAQILVLFLVLIQIVFLS